MSQVTTPSPRILATQTDSLSTAQSGSTDVVALKGVAVVAMRLVASPLWRQTQVNNARDRLKMFRIAAGAVLAAVMQFVTRWNRADIHAVRDAVRLLHAPVLYDPTVAAPRFRPSKTPAFRLYVADYATQ